MPPARCLLLPLGAWLRRQCGGRRALAGDDAGAVVTWDTTLTQTEDLSHRAARNPGAARRPECRRRRSPLRTRPHLADRTDLLSELDYTNGGFGVNVGLAAWYDPVYLHANHNDLPATFNPVSVPPDALPSASERIEGRDVDLLDAFVHDRVTLDSLPVTFRVGRYTLLWGESLFFGGNGVAALQAPQDEIRARTVPDSTAKELFLPVGQVSASLELRPGLSVEMYDQPEWRRERLPGVGTVFSTNDTLDLGGERLFLPNGQALSRGADRVPASAADQFGAALHATSGQTDLGSVRA